MLCQDELNLLPEAYEPYVDVNNSFADTNSTMRKAEFDLLDVVNGIQGKNKLLGELVRERWKIFTCSRLFDISYTKFPSISRIIKERLDATEIINTKQCHKFSVEISVTDPSTPGTNHGQPIWIKITTERSEIIVYGGLLFAWQSTQENIKENEYVDLPLLFCTGTAKYLDLVNGILMNLFHCTIESLFISQKNFIWIFGLVIQHIKSSPNTTVQLTYNTIVDTSCTFHVILQLDALKNIWNSINEGEYGKIREKDIILFYSGLQEHLCKVYRMDFTYYNLQALDIGQKVTINTKGKIQISNKSMLDMLLRFLSDFVCSSY